MSTDVSEVPAASIIALMMDATGTSETSADIQLRTRQYIPEDSELHTRRRENLKSHNSQHTSHCLKMIKEDPRSILLNGETLSH
jgi:hypothetical protein